MHGYRGNNRQCVWVTYLIGVLLTCLPGLIQAQRTNSEALIWYIPQVSTTPRQDEGNNIIEYTSLPDLAEKLARQAGKPYYLSLTLSKNTPADWKTLRTIPAANSLSILLADSVMSDSLLPILATWATLKKVAITAYAAPQSYTLITNAKGETTFGSEEGFKRIAKTGWDKLKAVDEVRLVAELDMGQAITALQALPALESLVIQQFINMKSQDVPAALAGLHRLRKLDIFGKTMSRNYAAVFRKMPTLTELTISDPDVSELNAGLTYLPNLRVLNITCFPANKLRLGSLPHLETLRLASKPEYTPLRITKDQVDAKRSIPLDSVLAGLTTLKRLSLEQLKLQAFPPSVLANKGLTYLSMPDVDVSSLPENLDQLVALEELILDNNPLHRLPDALGKLAHLRRLSVSKCELEVLPATIGQLTSLTNLSLNSNVLTALPASMGQLKQLRQLNVAMNQLTDLPDELGMLPKLETIAAFWNKITRFPASLTQVRELYLTDNLLATLPTSLSRMRRLRTLLLDNNPLTSLPESIGQLDSLETLVLGENQLTALPERLGSLRRLSRFELGTNQVRSLPESIGSLTSLTSVSLKNNPIERLPESIGAWQQITRVTLQLPHLVTLPAQIGRWQALQSLTIDSDRLLLLPDELTDCQQLELLKVTGNRLIGLPESIGKLTRLASLAVVGRADTLTGQGRGQVVALPASLIACKALTDLSVQHQQQFDGVEGMHAAVNLPALNGLAFVNCGFTELTGIVWKKLLVATLNLSQNRFSQLPVAVLDMPNLRQANFSETNLPASLNRFFVYRNQLVEALKTDAPK